TREHTIHRYTHAPHRIGDLAPTLLTVAAPYFQTLAKAHQNNALPSFLRTAPGHFRTVREPHPQRHGKRPRWQELRLQGFQQRWQADHHQLLGYVVRTMQARTHRDRRSV